ncbi:hypothetical protein [Celeribacter ethanolicus]|uniref:hypothetical protein n=1 Tax=Celeribacter ethanolicus TaxID=1758178 RepID=UPI000833FFE0|nr:hypothetical protein [Celeribacter ethanolicus]
MIGIVHTLAAIRLDHRHRAIRRISEERGPEVGKYILNRICARTWGDSPHLWRERTRHRRTHAAKMRRKSEVDPLAELWLGTHPNDFHRPNHGGHLAL